MLTGGSVEDVNEQGSGDGSVDAHTRRKLTGLCHDCESLTDGTHCPAHQLAAAERQRRYQARRRKRNRKRGICAECPMPSPDHYRCAVCRKALQAWKRARRDERGALRRVARSGDARPAVTDERTWKDSTGRNRYHGKAARGRQPTSVLDAQDVKLMTQTFDRARARLSALHDLPEDVTTAQRDHVRMLALDDFAYLVRLIEDDFLERHRYTERRARAKKRREVDHVQDRRLGGK